MPAESIDDAVSRFEMVRGRAEEQGEFDIGVGALAWMFLTQLGIPRSQWPTLLFPFAGQLPQDNA
eukprot:2984408-Lingulodinium_polyedra.AAC.1